MTLPIVIGVTGHRDLRPEDVPALLSALHSTFSELRSQYPASSFVLLSPLAEGADRLTARAALDAGMRLLVPLPMPRRLYEEDFAGNDSLREFAELIDRAEACFDLPLLPGTTEQEIASPGPKRDREYAKVGAFIATYSHVFLALWDGVEEDPTKVGGTAHIVSLRINGALPPYGPPPGELSQPSVGVVEHILTPRTSTPADGAFSRKTLAPDERSSESAARLLHHLDEFNHDQTHLHDELRDAIASSKAQLLQSNVSSVESVLAGLPPSCGPLLEHYAIADALSIHYARKTFTTAKRVFLGAAIAATLMNMHAFYYAPFFGHGPHETVAERAIAMPWFLIGFLVLYAFIALRLHRDAERGEYQNRHQDYRALAEALRIQFFWRVAGLGELVLHRYLRRHRSELEWIRSALLSSSLVMLAADSRTQRASASHDERMRFLVQHWVVEQRRYFASKATKEQRLLEREQRWSTWLLRTSVAIAALLAVGLSGGLVFPGTWLEGIRHGIEVKGVGGTIEITIVILAVSAGLLVAYGDQMARSEHVRQFTRMGELFQAAERQLAAAAQPEETRRIIERLGEEALDEAGDWLILHRERPLEVPHTG